MPPCAVCKVDSTQRCSRCQAAWYCSRLHQKQAWSAHSYFCHEPFQMGLYVEGQSTTVTPVCIPISTGKLETLPRVKLAALLSCPTSHLELVISPMSTLFGSDHYIVCAYNAGPGGPLYAGPTGLPFAHGPGELCRHAVHMTRSLVHSFGSQIDGNALFFYLKPKKDFLAEPDFDAAQAAIEAWNKADDCTSTTFKSLAETFKNKLKPATFKDRVEYFDVIIFPALGSKPFITKHPFILTSEYPFMLPCHFPVVSNFLGDGPSDYRWVGRTPKRGPLPHPLVVYMRDSSQSDKSPLNRSILTSTKGKTFHPWSGNIVVTKQRGREPGMKVQLDVNQDDVGAAIEYFAVYGKE